MAAVMVFPKFIPKGSAGNRSAGSGSKSSQRLELTPGDERGEASSDQHPHPRIRAEHSSLTKNEHDG